MPPDPSAPARKSSFPPIAAADARLLILGSLPGERSLAEQRYYAHPQNQFWRLMAAVLDEDLPALDYRARIVRLGERRIALWDVVGNALREGSADAAIREARTNDVAGLIASLPQLRAVAFNGGAAFRHGRPLLPRLGLPMIALPSSSPLHTVGFAAKLPAWLALRDILADP